MNPVSGDYVVGRCAFSLCSSFFSPDLVSSPFFDKVTIDLPSSNEKLVIIAPGAPSKPFVYSLSVNGHEVERPIIRHDQIAYGGVLSFQMKDTPQGWGSALTFQQ